MQGGDVPFTVPAVTFGLTVKLCDAETGLPQPEAMVYVMFVVPALDAVTKPELAFTVATVVLLLLQVPPAVPVLV